MRLYFFNNMYLSSIQHGAQSVHSFAQIVGVFKPGTAEDATMRAWLEHHKSLVFLNAGYASVLQKVFDRLAEIAKLWDPEATDVRALPFAKFHEEEDALGGALTSVAVIVPSGCYGNPRVRDSYATIRELQERASLARFDVIHDPCEGSGFTPMECLTLLCARFGTAH